MRARFLEQYTFLKENVHLSTSDFELKEKYSSAILFGLLSSVLNKKIIFQGEYGLGKTSLANAIGSLNESIPTNLIENNSLKGHSELTQEEIVGRVNLGQLNLGKEEVIWSNFSKSEFKIIDELNRIPENTQNVLLSGLQSDTWSYLNESIHTKTKGLIATTNYQDGANNNIIPPLLDRFDLRVEVKSPGVNISRIIRNKQDNPLENFALKTFDEQTRKEFYKDLEKNYSFKLLSKSEKYKIKEEIKAKKFDKDANLFLDVITAELTSCAVYGNKRSEDECPTGCHFSNYACHKINNPVSVRSLQAINDFSKALAWVEDKDVKSYHIQKIFPYALNHKLNIKEEEMEDQVREDSKQIHFSKILSNSINSRFLSIKKIKKISYTA